MMFNMNEAKIELDGVKKELNDAVQERNKLMDTLRSEKSEPNIKSVQKAEAKIMILLDKKRKLEKEIYKEQERQLTEKGKKSKGAEKKATKQELVDLGKQYASADLSDLSVEREMFGFMVERADIAMSYYQGKPDFESQNKAIDFRIEKESLEQGSIPTNERTQEEVSKKAEDIEKAGFSVSGLFKGIRDKGKTFATKASQKFEGLKESAGKKLEEFKENAGEKANSGKSPFAKKEDHMQEIDALNSEIGVLNAEIAQIEVKENEIKKQMAEIENSKFAEAGSWEKFQQLNGELVNVHNQKSKRVYKIEGNAYHIEQMGGTVNPPVVKLDEASKENAPSAPVQEEPIVEEPKKEEPVVEAPIVEEPKKEEPVVEAPIVEEPKKEEPVVEAPIVEEPKKEEPVVEVPIVEEPKKEEPVVEVPIVEEPKKEEPVVEVPIVEEPKSQPTQGVLSPAVKSFYVSFANLSKVVASGSKNNQKFSVSKMMQNLENDYRLGKYNEQEFGDLQAFLELAAEEKKTNQANKNMSGKDFMKEILSDKELEEVGMEMSMGMSRD